MIIVGYFGMPGCGKDAQVKELIKKLQNLNDFLHPVSTSDLLHKENIDTSSGVMISDDIVIELVNKDLQKHHGKFVILNGFPRTVKQAEYLIGKNWNDMFFVHIDIPEAMVLQRIEHRYQKAIDEGEKPRPDDNPETAKTRIEEYHKKTEPALLALEASGIPVIHYHVTDPNLTIQENFTNILRLLLLELNKEKQPRVKRQSPTNFLDMRSPIQERLALTGVKQY